MTPPSGEAILAAAFLIVGYTSQVHSAAPLLALLISAATVFAFPPAEQKEINELYRRGLGGDQAAVITCVDKLEGVLKTEPGNQLARVYLGSAYTLRSRDLGFGPKKLAALNHGIALMDEAVTATPDNPKVRLARALTTQALPFFVGRSASSRRDFEILADSAERSPAAFERGDLQIIFLNAGLAAKTNGNRARAAALFKEALRHPVDPALVAKTAEALAHP